MHKAALRATASSSRAARAAPAWKECARLQRRWLHERKNLPYPVENGLGDFLPPQALKMVALDYQQGLLDRLNEQVRGTGLEGKSVVQTVIEAARDPAKILAFNYASEALNNSFFLANLKPPTDGTLNHEKHLERSYILNSLSVMFHSFEHFKSSFSAAVTGMFSSGWLWLVCDNSGNLAIHPTFGPGTLLVRSRKEMANVYVFGEDMSDPVVEAARKRANAHAGRTTAPELGSLSSQPSSPTSGISHAPPLSMDPHTASRAFSTMSVRRSVYDSPANRYEAEAIDAASEVSPEENKRMGEILYPLFCVSVHEHAWVGAGYGVWGREEYMKRFWSVLDWEKVEKSYQSALGPPRRLL